MSRPEIRSGCSRACRRTSSGPGRPLGVRTANSSSPTRAVRASEGKAAASLPPRAARTRSARSWPRASLRRRKRSRSATTSTWSADSWSLSWTRLTKVRRSRRPVRPSSPEIEIRVSAATIPAARTPSSNHTPRQRPCSPPSMRSRSSTDVPGGCTRRSSPATALSWGWVRAMSAAPEPSGTSGPSPRGRAAPVKRIRSRSGSQSQSATEAAPSASSVAVASQIQRSFDIRLSGQAPRDPCRAAARCGGPMSPNST